MRMLRKSLLGSAATIAAAAFAFGAVAAEGTATGDTSQKGIALATYSLSNS